MIVTSIIPARIGSKRLKEKNIFPIWGKPMLYWAIKACKESKFLIDPWVTTDSEKISNIALELGANVVFRDENISNDQSFKQEAIRDAVSKIDKIKNKSDIYISLQPNSPQIKGIHLDMGIESLIKFNRDEIISCDDNNMQNGAFRIFRKDYVNQKDLSTNCGFVVCNLYDIHTIDDVNFLETRAKDKNEKD